MYHGQYTSGKSSFSSGLPRNSAHVSVSAQKEITTDIQGVDEPLEFLIKIEI